VNPSTPNNTAVTGAVASPRLGHLKVPVEAPCLVSNDLAQHE
jgi:hypothetical protein